MVEASGLLSATAGAPLPNSDTVGEIAAFADRQTAQLDKANVDKAGVSRMLKTCEDYEAKALDIAQQRVKPWWKRVF